MEIVCVVPTSTDAMEHTTAMPNDVQGGGRALHGSHMSLARSLSLASANIERVAQPEALQLLTAEEARQRFSFV